MSKARPYLLGLTGSIGMGKTTTAKMFADAGVPVWDADAAVHRLYEKGGAGVMAIAEVFPEAVVDGAVRRSVLRDLIKEDQSALAQIESVIHPLVAADRARFIDDNEGDILLFDIPLLFETGADQWLDAVVVVSASLEEQERRVLERPGMGQKDLAAILARQMPDAEKRQRADYVIETVTLESARAAVHDVIAGIRGQVSDA